MARPLRLPLALLLLAPAVALTDATFSSSELFFQIGGLQRSVMDAGGELRGEDVRLEHEDDRLVGELFGVALDLHPQSGQVSGTIAGQPVQLRVTATGAALGYEGVIGEERLSGIVSPQLLTAALGPCAAALGFISRAYEGRLDCGGGLPPQPFAIALPASLSSSPAEAQVALVAALMWTARGLAFPPPEPPPEADAGTPPEAAPGAETGIPPPVVIPPESVVIIPPAGTAPGAAPAAPSSVVVPGGVVVIPPAGAAPDPDAGTPPPVVEPGTIVVTPPTAAAPGADAGTPPSVIAPGAVVVAPPPVPPGADGGTPPVLEPGFGGGTELPATIEPGAGAGTPDAGTPPP